MAFFRDCPKFPCGETRHRNGIFWGRNVDSSLELHFISPCSLAARGKLGCAHHGKESDFGVEAIQESLSQSRAGVRVEAWDWFFLPGKQRKADGNFCP